MVKNHGKKTNRSMVKLAKSAGGRCWEGTTEYKFNRKLAGVELEEGHEAIIGRVTSR